MIEKNEFARSSLMLILSEEFGLIAPHLECVGDGVETVEPALSVYP
jgi:hypothetical protein